MRDSRLRDSLSDLAPRFFRKVARTHNKALKPFNLSAVQGHILAVLWLQGPMLVGELQRQLDLGSSTLTGALDRMEKAELCKRVPLAEDRRSFRVEPVAWPARRKEELFDVLAATDDLLCASLSAGERKTLARLLRKVIDAEVTGG